MTCELTADCGEPTLRTPALVGVDSTSPRISTSGCGPSAPGPSAPGVSPANATRTPQLAASTANTEAARQLPNPARSGSGASDDLSGESGIRFPLVFR